MTKQSRSEHKPRIFLCHASEDKPGVEELYHQLKEAGYDPWLDKEDLLPGQDWRREIRKIITDPYNLVVVCLSQKSTTKRGVVQQEIKWALDVLDQMPEETIYLIPARLEPCQAPDRLADLHWVNLFEPDGFDLLKRSLDFEIGKRKLVQRTKLQFTERVDPKLSPREVDQALPCEEEIEHHSPAEKKRRQSQLTKVTRTSTPAKKNLVPTPFPRILSSRKPYEPELILIPAGEFLMGSVPKKDRNACDDEQPQHTVYLPDYYIAKIPVTNAQYVPFVQETNHRQPEQWKGGQPPPGKHAHPVVNISWHDAVAYCNWLTEKSTRSYRLPTEAEWEKAARGTDGRIYPWGNQWDGKRCNTREAGQNGTTRPETYPNGASPYGLLDMAGNVWEWCATKWRKNYPYYVQENEWCPVYLESYDFRVLRGGSWDAARNFARCAYRLRVDASYGNSDFGFRLVVPSFRIFFKRSS